MYDHEALRGARTIVGASTSIAMFVGRTKQGPLEKPVRCLNYTSFKNTFSEDASFGDMARYVRLFFQNGGTDCYVMRINNDYENAYRIIERDVDLFNLLVLPPDPTAERRMSQLWGLASAFCERRRAFLLMDPPTEWDDAQAATDGVAYLRTGLKNDYSAVFYPRLWIRDDRREVLVGPSGAIAGLMARFDSSRGVWKAPAGTEATLRGVSGVQIRLSDGETATLNSRGINTLRVFANGIANWGARTNAGDDDFPSEWKYIPVRRLALFIEESLYRGLKWVVSEPNDEFLWAQIRLYVGMFLRNLFRQGAFQGASPQEAYFVKCDSETTTADDRNRGIVNIWIGFAPLKPAEFVVLYLQQMAGPIEV
jgi:phage tail sheath protein FI